MRINGTFLDEISHDIPHQNWGPEEWDRDFQAMKRIGIDTVIMIRCGFKRWMTYSSEVLKAAVSAYEPPLDLVEMYLRLAEKYGMDFFFGTYDSGNPWWNEGYQVEPEVELMQKVAEEAWTKYGHHKAFRGWYLSQEIARRTPAAVECYKRLAVRCKQISGNLPILISPGMLGSKALNEKLNPVENPIAAAAHEEEWDEIMKAISSFVDIIAFQDGHVDYELLPEFLAINKKLCAKYGIQCWSNVESFDRDMPIRFLPIKWEKMLLKMREAEKSGVQKFITFEFSHFMSPNSCYLQAGNLYKRYCEHFGL